MHARLRITFESDAPKIIEASAPVLRLGRQAECEVPFDGKSFPRVSSVHSRIEPVAGGFALVHVSVSNKTLLNDVELAGSSRVQVGDRVRLGYTGPTIEILALNASSLADGCPEAVSDRTIQADSRHLAILRGTLESNRYEVGRGGVIGRDADRARFLIDHPLVSRLHASISVQETRAVIADLGSPNGTFLNGRRLSSSAELSVGDRIDVGPFSLRFDGESLTSRSRANNVELAAQGIGRSVHDRATGRPLKLLDEIDLVIHPREFVCILGPSGSGKSTLLSILSGRLAPDRGDVRINGECLFSKFDALKGDIAVVPQRDVLHTSLSVGDALAYTAELRLPPDSSREEVDAAVSDILEVVDLSNRRHTLIKNLSGGQVKRASLANEIVSRASLLFLDEVTSGLDEQTDREVMQLFRQVADGGKTVVCITHNLANVEVTCHLVIVLAAGGQLAYVGTPEEAQAHFQIARLGEIYTRLAEKPAAQWHREFRASPAFRKYVADRLSTSSSDVHRRAESVVEASVQPSNVLRQAWVLTRRYIMVLRGDWRTLATLAGQSLLIAILLGIVFGDLRDGEPAAYRNQQTRNLFLLLNVSCFWFGCNSASKELVKERAIFHRERDFNLHVRSYLASKLVVLTLLCLIQVSLLLLIVSAWCRPEGSLKPQWVILACVAAAGMAIGLFLSSLAESEDVANALVPLVVIPQIILAGVVAPLSGCALWLARAFTSVYWSQSALERLLPSGEHGGGTADDARWDQPLLALGTHFVLSCVLCAVWLIRSSSARK